MKRLYLSASLLFYGSFSSALGIEDIAQNLGWPKNCEPQLEQFIQKQKLRAPIHWEKGISNGEFVFKVPTHAIGKWVIVAPRHVTIADRDATGIHQLDLKTCALKKMPAPTRGKRNDRSFTDLDLERLVQLPELTMIYIWSPQQIYSIQSWPNYQRVAVQGKLKFQAVSSKSSLTLNEVKLVPHLYSLPNSSNELNQLGATIHTPTILFAGRGKLSHPIVGALRETTLRLILEKERRSQ